MAARIEKLRKQATEDREYFAQLERLPLQRSLSAREQNAKWLSVSRPRPPIGPQRYE
ncbi:hypothetical protein ACFPRL_34865 [Pseudoclavibacter helvolus]